MFSRRNGNSPPYPPGAKARKFLPDEKRHFSLEGDRVLAQWAWQFNDKDLGDVHRQSISDADWDWRFNDHSRQRHCVELLLPAKTWNTARFSSWKHSCWISRAHCPSFRQNRLFGGTRDFRFFQRWSCLVWNRIAFPLWNIWSLCCGNDAFYSAFV